MGQAQSQSSGAGDCGDCQGNNVYGNIDLNLHTFPYWIAYNLKYRQ